MKIALLSFHNAVNYGAALQAYALQRFLLNVNIDNDYINYENRKRYESYSMSFLMISSLKRGYILDFMIYMLGAPFLCLRKQRFREFYKKNLRTTERLYKNSSEARELNGVYDKFIVGSDQVWNFENNGADFAYLLNFVNDNTRKISYSSSFGIANIPELYREDYAKCLSEFKHLAVRESFGVNLIKELTNRDSKLVLDPVFLLSKAEWLAISSNKHINEKYIFSYTNRALQFEEFIRMTHFSMDNYKHYKLSRQTSILDFISTKTKVKYIMSPNDFIDVINNAQLIVSASFHCISMAIILNKPFVAILTGDEGKDERIINILTLLNLRDRILDKSMDLNKIIDYDQVNSRIDELRSESISYLLDAIKE